MIWYVPTDAPEHGEMTTRVRNAEGTVGLAVAVRLPYGSFERLEGPVMEVVYPYEGREPKILDETPVFHRRNPPWPVSFGGNL